MNRIRAVHQFLPSLMMADAISNHARLLRNFFIGLGYSSSIYTSDADKESEKERLPYTAYAPDKSDAVFYHHSIGCFMTEYLALLDCTKILIYHNITPPAFFERYNREMTYIVRKGRSDLVALKGQFVASLCDSVYNMRELEQIGYSNLYTIPISFDDGRLDIDPDESILKSYNDQDINMLHVGRIVPNKRITDLIKTFFYYHKYINKCSRLFIVGEINPAFNVYIKEVQFLIDYLGLNDKVVMPGKVSDSQLRSYYELAHIYMSMSEHEGFCVPLLEAMHHKIPIVAYKSTGITELLNGAGILFTKKDYPRIAELVHIAVTDDTLRKELIEAQFKRLLFFSPESIKQKLTHVLHFLGRDGSN